MFNNYEYVDKIDYEYLVLGVGASNFIVGVTNFGIRWDIIRGEIIMRNMCWVWEKNNCNTSNMISRVVISVVVNR